MQIKKFYFDLETTGVDAFRNAIHQIAAIIEIDGKVKETINWNIKSFGGAIIEKEALEVGGVTEDQLKKYYQHFCGWRKNVTVQKHGQQLPDDESSHQSNKRLAPFHETGSSNSSRSLLQRLKNSSCWR